MKKLSTTCVQRRIQQVVFASAAVFVVFGTCGCGTTLFTSRGTNPAIQDFNLRWWADSSTLATTASRRLALMSYKTDPITGKVSLQTCAEPPPDVGETFAKALAAQVEAEVVKSGVDAQAQAGISMRVATAIAPLLVRSQGLQLMRDSSFTLCIDFMNGWIASPQDYERIKQERFSKIVKLIELELPLLAKRVGEHGPPELPTSETAPGRSTSRSAPSQATPPAAAASQGN